MKNIIQSFFSASQKGNQHRLFSLLGILLLLFAFILSGTGKNKVPAKKTGEAQKASETKISDPATRQLINGIDRKAGNILFQSADGGNTWQNLSAGLPENIRISHVFTQGNEVFAGTWDGVVYHCYDINTGEWMRENIGGFYEKEAITGIFQGRSGPYVSVANRGFFRRIPGTGFWQPLGKTLKDYVIHDIKETADGTIFVASAAGIFKSQDEGSTWKHVFTTGWVTSLSSANGVIMAAAMQGVLRSEDGEHWECVLPDEGAIYKTSVIEGNFAVLRVAAPWSGSAKEISSVSSAGDIRLRTSADGGKTWQTANGNGLSAKGIFDIEQAGKYLFFSSDAGISRSADGGKNWELVRPAIKDKDNMTRMEITSADDIIYALVVNAGC